MKHFKFLALAATFLPALALAQIANTRHDMASGSTAAIRSDATATGTTQTCIFCHTPHKSIAQDLIWNRRAIAGTRGWTSGSTTTSGTALPTDIGAPSKVCLSCHDATIGLGEVNNVGNGSAGTITMLGGITQPGNGYRIGNGAAPAMLNNHPVSIPYAGSTGYAGQPASGVTGLSYTQGYVAPSSTGCESPGYCTGGTVGVQIRLYGTALTATGIECGSCHEVHNKYGNSYFLRAPATGSTICKQCHIK